MNHTHSTPLFIDILLWGVGVTAIVAVIWLFLPAFRRDD